MPGGSRATSHPGAKSHSTRPLNPRLAHVIGRAALRGLEVARPTYGVRPGLVWHSYLATTRTPRTWRRSSGRPPPTAPSPGSSPRSDGNRRTARSSNNSSSSSGGGSGTESHSRTGSSITGASSSCGPRQAGTGRRQGVVPFEFSRPSPPVATARAAAALAARLLLASCGPRW
jgi:hypothetical protein